MYWTVLKRSTRSALHGILLVQHLLLAMSRAGDIPSTANKQLIASGGSDGTLSVTWGQNNDEGTSYVLSYTYSDASNTTVTRNVSTTEQGVDISGAFLGVNYHIKLQCSKNGGVFEQCADLIFLALPTCPNGWYQHETQCYYLSLRPGTWTTIHDTCRSLSSTLSDGGEEDPKSNSEADLNQMVAKELTTKGELLFWTAIDACDRILPDDILKFNCCLSLNSIGNVSTVDSLATSSNFRTCSEEQELPFLCTKEVEARTTIAGNVSVHSMTNDSVIIAWTESTDDQEPGWNLAWRTVTVYDKNRTLVANVLASNALRSALTPPLKCGQTYNVLIWPHKMGYLLADAIGTTFYLVCPLWEGAMNAGALTVPVRMHAVLDWRGWISVSWAAARRKKHPFIEYDADKYQLIYGLLNASKSDYVKVNLTRIQRTYAVNKVQGNQEFRFYLVCFIGTIAISCGTIQKFKVELPNVMVETGDRYVSYQRMSESGPQTWEDAELECVQRNGHLISIESPAEAKNVSHLFPAITSFWIGANRSANGSIEWSDGSAWYFTNGLKMDPHSLQDQRCLLATYDSRGVSIWNFIRCNATFPYLCKYVMSRSDLGVVMNLTTNFLLPSTLQMKWRTPNQLWPISKYTYRACAVTSASGCTTMPVKFSPLIVSGLKRNTTYRLDLTAYVASPPIKISTSAFVTSDNELEVRSIVNPDGRLTLDWSRYSSGTSIIYVVEPQTGNDGPSSSGTSNMIDLSGLQFALTYNFTLRVIDNGTGAVLDSTSFTVTARPSCAKDEFQTAMKCYFIGDLSNTWDQGRKTCQQREGGEVAYPASNDETAFLRHLSDDMDSPFWIDGQTSSSIIEENADTIRALDTMSRSGKVRRQANGESGCRIISNQDPNRNKSVGVATCSWKLPFMCQRTLTVDAGSVSKVVLENVSSNGMTIRWSSPPWKPAEYEVVVIALNANARDKRSTDGNVVVDENSVTIKDLQPESEYQVDITPIVDNVRGETMSVHVATLEPNSTAAPYPLPLTGSADNSGMDNVTSPSESGVSDLRTFRLISCLTLIVLTVVAFTVFAACSMYRYRDCMSQMCFEVSLVIAHILVLLDVDTRDKVDCKAVSMGIHFFFSAAFFFFTLECFCHVKAMTKLIPLAILNRTWQYFSIGWMIPVIILIVSASTVNDDYVRKSQYHCWLNVEGRALMATVIPISIFAGLAMLFLCLAICCRPEENYEVDEESYIRYEPLQDVRWMLLFMLGLLVSHWAVGMMAAYEGDGSLFLAFIVLTIVLAISILILRCIGDGEIRFRVKSCCQGSSIGPGDEDIGNYLSKPFSKKGTSSEHVATSEGMLIVRKTYIFRP